MSNPTNFSLTIFQLSNADSSKNWRDDAKDPMRSRPTKNSSGSNRGVLTSNRFHQRSTERSNRASENNWVFNYGKMGNNNAKPTFITPVMGMQYYYDNSSPEHVLHAYVKSQM